MNVNKKLLLTLSSAALLLAAPLTAQVQARPYALKIQVSADELFIGGGRPTVPVGLMVGIKQQFVPLPGGAMLRLVPEEIVVLGQFNKRGEYSLPLVFDRVGPFDPPVTFFVQALSVQDEVLPAKLCTSELLAISTDFRDYWYFLHLN